MSCISRFLPTTYTPDPQHRCACISANNLNCRIRCNSAETVTERSTTLASDNLLLSAIRGEAIERPPVWLMRQAGRYMKSYQVISKKYPSFRERSENVDLIVDISLQPWRAFRPDAVILFSDILTPFTGMNIPFDIVEGKGPIILDPLATIADIHRVRELHPPSSVPYVGEALRILREEVADRAAVLGFVGGPFTLASYAVEGGTSRTFTKIKRLAFSQPAALHALLEKLAVSMATYIEYQADCGAQAVQIFDSWAAELSPADFREFSLHYLKRAVTAVRRGRHAALPLILYVGPGSDNMASLSASGVDVISLDWRVDMADDRIPAGVALQGNIDPGVLFGSQDLISQRVRHTVAKAAGRRHILNLGHGVLPGTPEDNVAHFFETARQSTYLLDPR